MSDGMRRELVYLSSHATNRYFIPNWGILQTVQLEIAVSVGHSLCVAALHRHHSSDKSLVALLVHDRSAYLLGESPCGASHQQRRRCHQTTVSVVHPCYFLLAAAKLRLWCYVSVSAVLKNIDKLFTKQLHTEKPPG